MQKNSLRIAFLMGLTFSATLFAQPNKKLNRLAINPMKIQFRFQQEL